MRQLILLVAVLLAASSLLCASDGGYDVIDWKGSAKGLPGDLKGELKHPVKGSLVMKYHLYAPATIPDKPHLGLIICFHGLGGDENGMSGMAHMSLGEIGAASGYIVAGGKSTGNGWAPSDEALVLQFIDWIETVYPIDHRRVFVYGHSNGGWMTSWFGSRHPDRFTGLVRWSGYGADLPGKNGAGEEYYLVHGDADPTVKVDQSRNLRDQLLRGGYHYVYREIHDGDHGSILGIKAVRMDAARWMDAQRHKDIAPPDEDLKWLRLVSADKSGELLAKPETWDGLVRIGGAPAWQVIAKTAKSKVTAERLALAKACARCRFADEETISAMAKLAEDEDAGVRAAALTALTMHANWRSQSAQTALIRLALAKKRPAEDQLAATSSLAVALGLPMLGTFTDDPALFEGTVTLLDNENADIRTAISTPLKIAVKDMLGYDPQAAAPARKPTVAAWQQWFAEHANSNGKAVGKK